MPHYDEFWPGRFRKGTTIERPMTVRIVSLSGEELEGDDGTKAKGILKYKTRATDGTAVTEEIVLAKTNAILMAAIFESTDYTKWAGHLVTLCFDPSVTIGKDRVGGIRVCGSPELKKAIVVDVKRPRRKKVERYTLQPTDGQGRTRAQAAPESATPPSDEPPPEFDNRDPGVEG